jgi:hypothetical protein
VTSGMVRTSIEREAIAEVTVYGALVAIPALFVRMPTSSEARH